MPHRDDGGRAVPAARLPLLRFSAAFLVALCVASVHLLSGGDVLPIQADSAKYDGLAKSVERVLHDPALGRAFVQRELQPAERDSLGFERWEFQHAPAFVVPLGVLYALFPNDEGIGRAFSVLLYAASAGLLVLLAGWFVGRKLAWLALLLYLFYLPLLYYGLGIATEGFTTFSLLLSSTLLVRFHRRPSPRRAGHAGLGLALLFLAKTTLRPLAVLICAGEVLWLTRQHRWPQVKRMALGAIVPPLVWGVLLIAAGIPLNPLARSGEDALWAYRGNYVPDGGWETTGLGDAITPELLQGSRSVEPPAPGIEPGLAERRAMYWGGLRATIAHDPLGWLALAASKFGLFWTYPARKIVTRGALGAWRIPREVHLLLFPLGLLGLASVMGRRGGWWLPGALALGVAGVHAVTHMVARYQIPVLSIWFLYALLGVKGLVRAALSYASPARRRMLAQLPWIPLCAGLAAWILGGFLMRPPAPVSAGVGRGLYLAGGLLRGLAPLGLAPLLVACATRMRPALRTRAWYLWAAPVLLALPATGGLVGARDWDEFACRLDAPGETLVQRIGLPPVLRGEASQLVASWLEIDMLRSVHGSFRLEVRVQGEPVHVFADTLDGDYGSFLFEPEVHIAMDRYRRVAETYRAFVTGWLNPHYGRASPGYDYFRRWVRVEVPTALCSSDTLEVELRMLAASGGGWVQVYGDRYLQAGRTYVGPAIGENPFEWSHYRAEFFAGDRERTDARLIRPRSLYSPWSGSLRREGARLTPDLDPGWRRQTGELRLRLRVRIPGMLAARTVEGREVPVWVAEPRDGERPFGPDDVRRFQWWRDKYFDGTRVL